MKEFMSDFFMSRKVIIQFLFGSFPFAVCRHDVLQWLRGDDASCVVPRDLSNIKTAICISARLFQHFLALVDVNAV